MTETVSRNCFLALNIIVIIDYCSLRFWCFLVRFMLTVNKGYYKTFFGCYWSVCCCPLFSALSIFSISFFPLSCLSVCLSVCTCLPVSCSMTVKYLQSFGICVSIPNIILVCQIHKNVTHIFASGTSLYFVLYFYENMSFLIRLYERQYVGLFFCGG